MGDGTKYALRQERRRPHRLPGDGEGLLDLVFVPRFVSHVEASWQSPGGAKIFRGREIDTTGDGFLATFDGPARGIRCAGAIVDAVKPLGVAVRAGLHTGECEVIGEKLSGEPVVSPSSMIRSTETARAFGLTIPPSRLLRADHFIE